VLITGSTGFSGPYVAAEAARQDPNIEIYGMAVNRPASHDVGLFPAGVHHLLGDVTDSGDLRSALEASAPDVIFHLAAASSGAASWSKPTEYFEINAMGTLRLLEAVRDLALDATVVVASSGEIYGAAPDDEHRSAETAPYRPISPYATSKAAQDLIAAQFGEAYGLPVMRLRLFNQTGPRRPPNYVASSFARQIVEIERGLRAPKIEVGNLEARRDFIDVRDAARAYWLAAQHGSPGSAYNVCSGRAVSIAEVLDLLLSQSAVEVEIVPDPDRMRPADIPLLVGDPTLFHSITGWKPEIALEQTLSDLLQWWRQTD
jgi:GDP-4-dehydro-6-deoxy-D-mannose reductase